MKNIRLYLFFCGITYLMNATSVILFKKEIVEGNIYKLLFPLIMVLVSMLIDRINRPRLKNVG